MPNLNFALQEAVKQMLNPKTKENLDLILGLLSDHNTNYDLSILQVKDLLRPLAFLAVEKENIFALELLVRFDKGLLDIFSLANHDTLLIRACSFLKIDVVECLLKLGANPNLSNSHGNTPAMYCVYSQNKEGDYDLDVVEILKLLQDSGANFRAVDFDNDTLLIESVAADLKYTTHFLLDCFRKDGVLDHELNHSNSDTSTHNFNTALMGINRSDKLSALLLNQEEYSCSKNDYLLHLLGKINFSLHHNDLLQKRIKKLLCFVEVENLSSFLKKIFCLNLVESDIVPDTSYNNVLLVESKPIGHSGEKIFSIKDFQILRTLAVAGADFLPFKGLVESLPSIKKEEALKNLHSPSYAVILEEDKQKILDLINASINLRSFLSTNLEGDIASLEKEIALDRLCFLIFKNKTNPSDSLDDCVLLADFIQQNYQIQSRFLESRLIQEYEFKIEDLKEYLPLMFKCYRNISYYEVLDIEVILDSLDIFTIVKFKKYWIHLFRIYYLEVWL